MGGVPPTPVHPPPGLPSAGQELFSACPLLFLFQIREVCSFFVLGLYFSEGRATTTTTRHLPAYTRHMADINCPDLMVEVVQALRLKVEWIFLLMDHIKNKVEERPWPKPHAAKRMADHDRRREAIKRQRSRAREELHANQEMANLGNLERVLLGEIKEGEFDGDLAAVLHDLAHCYLASTAKAA
ncbi:hypothetical protein CJ030_MR1G029178 [Morella rubra]|uniref:Uncharacterized protein n=1 Tax=Morella rubra TaxID=262757 RepID=A0A6A1WLM0_9ROSI|nr:hypothetical protein CJ030_MR1G029178 [Morella rubra]